MEDQLLNIITEMVERIARRVYYEEAGKNGRLVPKSEDEMLDVRGAAAIVKLSVSRVYALVAAGKLPTINPRGTGKLRFSRKRLMAWLSEPNEETTSSPPINIQLKPLKHRKKKAS